MPRAATDHHQPMDVVDMMDNEGFVAVNSKRGKKRRGRGQRHVEQQSEQPELQPRSKKYRQQNPSQCDVRKSQQESKLPKQSKQTSNNSSTDERAKVLEEIFDAVLTQSTRNRHESTSSECSSQSSQSTQSEPSCSDPSAEIDKLKEQVRTLTSQVQFLLTYFGISANQPLNGNQTNDQTNDHTHATNELSTGATCSYADVTRRLHGPMRNAVLSTVHKELRAKNSRQNNVVVTGLANNDQCKDDLELITWFCAAQWGFTPPIVSCKRLGAVKDDRPQPLLVVLTCIEHARNLINLSHDLHKSSDQRACRVYINPDLTPAEARVAYEDRCRRRLRQQTETETDMQTTENTAIRPSTSGGRSQQYSQPRRVNKAATIAQPSTAITTNNTAGYIPAASQPARALNHAAAPYTPQVGHVPSSAVTPQAIAPSARTKTDPAAVKSNIDGTGGDGAGTSAGASVDGSCP